MEGVVRQHFPQGKHTDKSLGSLILYDWANWTNWSKTNEKMYENSVTAVSWPVCRPVRVFLTGLSGLHARVEVAERVSVNEPKNAYVTGADFTE